LMEHVPGVTLADVLPSAAASVEVTGFHDTLGIGSTTHVVVCLVDGLGALAIDEHRGLFDSVEGARGGSIEAAFPTTTATGVATLGTGLPAGQHGMVGANFWVPEEEIFLSPLHWGKRPSPRAVQPESTVFEIARDQGVATFVISPGAYENSGLTAAALRGAEYQVADDLADRIQGVRACVSATDRALIYVYWPALDRAGHEHGSDSLQWLEAATDVNHLIGALREVLPDRGALVITADHGMVDCDERMWLEDYPELSLDVRAVAGEPRMRHIYTEHPEDVARRWSDVLADHSTVVLREEAISQGWFGVMDPVIAPRIGDVLAMSIDRTCMSSRFVDEGLSRLRGQHGAMTDAERLIPGLILDP
jgi:predicted AlkP superfamily pyrophosphatase or phosphodiesterase